MGAWTQLSLGLSMTLLLGPQGAMAQGGGETPTPVMSPSEPPQLTSADTATEERAKELYDNGAALYKEERYSDAIMAFEEAYRLSREPLLFFNIAKAYQKMGAYQEAIDALNHYRVFAPKEERDSLTERISALEELLAEAETRAEPPLEPPSEEAAPPEVEAPPEAEPSLELEAETDEVLPHGEAPGSQEPEGRLKAMPLWIPVVMGASLGSFALGAGAGFRSLAYTQEAASYCLNADSGQLICSAEADVPLACAKRDALIADVALSLGVGAAIAGGVGLLRHRVAREATGPLLAPWLDPAKGAAGLRLSGQF